MIPLIWPEGRSVGRSAAMLFESLILYTPTQVRV